MKDPRRIFELGRELGDLERQKRNIEERIRQIRVESETLTGQHEPTKAVASRSANGVVGRVLAVLEGAPNKKFHWVEVHQASGVKGPTARSTLARLYSERRIERPGRGIYQAKRGD